MGKLSSHLLLPTQTHTNKIRVIKKNKENNELPGLVAQLFRRLRQEDGKFKSNLAIDTKPQAGLCDTVRLCLEVKTSPAGMELRK